MSLDLLSGPARRRTRWGRVAALLLVAIVTTVVALILNAYSDDIRVARQRVLSGSAVIETPCGVIEYAAIGSGPPILVVHGAGGGFDQGTDFGQPLASAGFRVIAMSRFGYLRTPMPANASAAAQADAHACLLDALGIEAAAVVGASAGAPSSMQFALRHPERCTALVLLVPAAYVPRPDNAPPMKTPAGTQFLFDTALKSDFLFWAAIRLVPDTVMRAILATPPAVVQNASSDERARVSQMMERILPVSPRRLGLLNDAAVTSSLERYELERMSTRTLAISMADDLFGTFDGARYTVEHVPDGRFVGYPSGGHVWVGHQQEIMSAIAAFVK